MGITQVQFSVTIQSTPQVSYVVRLYGRTCSKLDDNRVLLDGRRRTVTTFSHEKIKSIKNDGDVSLIGGRNA